MANNVHECTCRMRWLVWSTHLCQPDSARLMVMYIALVGILAFLQPRWGRLKPFPIPPIVNIAFVSLHVSFSNGLTKQTPPCYIYYTNLPILLSSRSFLRRTDKNEAQAAWTLEVTVELGVHAGYHTQSKYKGDVITRWASCDSIDHLWRLVSYPRKSAMEDRSSRNKP